MAERPPAPTAKDLLGLPHWARVAFAARASRRVHSMGSIWPELAGEFAEADAWISRAEITARNGHTDISIWEVVKTAGRHLGGMHFLGDFAVRSAAEAIRSAAEAATAAVYVHSASASAVAAAVQAATGDARAVLETAKAASDAAGATASAEQHSSECAAAAARAASHSIDAALGYAGHMAAERHNAENAKDPSRTAGGSVGDARAAMRAEADAIGKAHDDAYHTVIASLWSDFDRLVELARAGAWSNETAVDPDWLGPLWAHRMAPEGLPEALVQDDTGGFTLSLELPDGTSDEDAERLAIEYIDKLDTLHRALGGHGLRIIPPVECHEPAVVVQGVGT